MTVPCESKEDITGLVKEQTRQGKDIAVMKDSTDRMRVEQVEFIKESREVIGLLKEMAIEGKASAVHAKEAQDILFSKFRENRNDIRILADKFLSYQVERNEAVEKIIEPVVKDVQELKEDKITRESKSLLLRDFRVTVPAASALVSTAILLWEKIKH